MTRLVYADSGVVVFRRAVLFLVLFGHLVVILLMLSIDTRGASNLRQNTSTAQLSSSTLRISLQANRPVLKERQKPSIRPSAIRAASRALTSAVPSPDSEPSSIAKSDGENRRDSQPASLSREIAEAPSDGDRDRTTSLSKPQSSLDLTIRPQRQTLLTPRDLALRDPRSNTTRATKWERFAIRMGEFECVSEVLEPNGGVRRGPGRLSKDPKDGASCFDTGCISVCVPTIR